MLQGMLGPASGDERGTTVRPLDHMSVKLLRSAVVRWRVNDMRIRSEPEFEGVEAIRQALPDGFQRRFLEAPELAKCPLLFQTADLVDRIRLGDREKPMREVTSRKIARLVFEIDADTMCRRPRAEETEPAGGKTKPEIR